MKYKEVQERTPQLIQRLVEVWEDSVKATHLFLSPGEIAEIKRYVPAAPLPIWWWRSGITACRWPLWGFRTEVWKRCFWRRKRGGRAWAASFCGMGSSGIPSRP